MVLHIKRLWSLVMRGETTSELTKNGYIQLNLRLYKALMPEFDNEEAIEAAETDWQNDVGNADVMGFGGFFDSVFELIDIWVPEVSNPGTAHPYYVGLQYLGGCCDVHRVLSTTRGALI